MSDGTLVSAALAGTIATIAESTITYPLEYVKSRRQLAVRPLAASLPPFSVPHLTSVMYQGWSPFVVGNAVKAWLRFNVFNAATKFMSEGTGGSVSAPVVVVSGVMTGIAETLVVVPFESIKTTMIEASSVGKGAALGALPALGVENTQLIFGAKSVGSVISTKETSTPKAQTTSEGSKANPRSSNIRPSEIRPSNIRPVGNASSEIHPIHSPQGMLKTIRDMYRARGVRVFIQGFNPTVFRQVFNSIFRFTSWNAWMQLVALDGEQSMSLYQVLIGSAAASGVEAIATQPLDVIKSRMQSTNALKLYGNSLFCAYKVFTEEGWKQLWSGLAPRWIRKWIGGGILWAVYEVSYGRLEKMMREKPFE